MRTAFCGKGLGSILGLRRDAEGLKTNTKTHLVSVTHHLCSNGMKIVTPRQCPCCLQKAATGLFLGLPGNKGHQICHACQFVPVSISALGPAGFTILMKHFVTAIRGKRIFPIFSCKHQPVLCAL